MCASKVIGRTRLLVLGVIFGLVSGVLLGPSARAQSDSPETTPPPQSLGPDPADEMRRFIEDTARYAHSLNRNFVVIAAEASDLATRDIYGDGSDFLPAITFLQSIDGIMELGVRTRGRGSAFGKPLKEAEMTRKQALLDMVKAQGVSVFTVDFSADVRRLQTLYQENARHGFVPLVIPQPLLSFSGDLTAPSRPWAENSSSVLSLSKVRNFLLVKDPAAFGRQEEFALKFHQNNYDMLIVDPFYRRNEPLRRQIVDMLKYKQTGARRLVLARLNIGVAAPYRYYWQRDWREGFPAWISDPSLHYPDTYWVKYWAPEWQDIVFGNAGSQIYGLIVDLGFDGVLLEGVEAYRFQNGTLEY